jgi:hypothetical protein
MIVVVIRDGSTSSLKGNFVVQLFRQNNALELFYVLRKEQNKFEENWQKNQVELATSVSGIFGYFLLIRSLISPKDLHDSMINRIMRRKIAPGNKGFITTLSEALYQYFARSARPERLLHYLDKFDKPIIFIVDEFFSLNTVDIKKLKKRGRIIYVSSDIAADFYGDNFAASKLMYKLEKDSITLPDLVIACSERDRLKYIKLGGKKVFFYPNIYPINFELSQKDASPSIAIVLRGHWGSKAKKSLEKIIITLACIDKPIKVYMIGIKPQQPKRNVVLKHYEYIPSREDYLEIISKSWIGINLGIHSGGSNQRKYDYALAGLVVFSDTFGARGDLLPNEYTYVDYFDLVAKLNQLLSLGKERIVEMGQQNRKQALSLAKEKREELIKTINEI